MAEYVVLPLGILAGLEGLPATQTAEAALVPNLWHKNFGGYGEIQYLSRGNHLLRLVDSLLTALTITGSC